MVLLVKVIILRSVGLFDFRIQSNLIKTFVTRPLALFYFAFTMQVVQNINYARGMNEDVKVQQKTTKRVIF